ncbi:MAG: cytidylate kinase [Syntrophorhabdus sp. PtaU1.Bin050]|jgi:cytidylate kinase|nr:MAG: cytidylate kinase [Syntrophorhabdus sp. PtaU1.Bin050]
MAIVTISREFGSGGREVGHAIADAMGYEYIDRKRILEDMRKEGKIWEEKAKHFDENYPNLWERNDWAFRGFVALNQSHFVNHALRGNVVLMGRGGNFLLKQFRFVLKVRIKAPFEQRVERVMARDDINRENAEYLVEKADSEMAKAVYLIYGRDWDDPQEYDMVFDTSKESLDVIIPEVKKALLEKEKYNTPEERQALEIRAMAEKIKAAILSDPDLIISMLDVDPREEGLAKYGLVVRGLVHKREDVGLIEGIVKRLAGNIPIEFRVQYRAYPRFGRIDLT